MTGAGGSARPIELHSHDPLRYTGDMLAWLHQATASEKEQVQSLVKLCPQQGTLVCCARQCNTCTMNMSDVLFGLFAYGPVHQSAALFQALTIR